MKNLRINMDLWYEKLDKNWRTLPVGRQHRYILYFFTGYVLLTVGVISKAVMDISKSDSEMVIEHIESPVLKTKKNPVTLQDSILSTLKNNTYEGK